MGYKKYTYLEKVEALIALRNNDYNISKSVTPSSRYNRTNLKRWKDEDSKIIFSLLDDVKGDTSKLNEKDFIRIKQGIFTSQETKTVSEANYEDLIRKGKILAIEELTKRIKKATTPAHVVLEAFKVLHEMDKEEEPEGLKKAGTPDEYARLLLATYNFDKKKVS